MVQKIQNIQLKRLNTLETSQYDDYRKVLQYLKPKPVIKGRKAKDIMQLTFNEVELIKTALKDPQVNNLIDIFYIIFGINRKKLLNCKLVEFFHAYNYVIREINSIVEKEMIALKFEVDPLMNQAGLERLNRFGVLNTLDSLAMRYGTHPDKVKEWQYGYCFSLLYKMNIEKRIENDYREIVKSNSK